MSLDKLKRVIWRLQDKGIEKRFSIMQLRRAIMDECGTDERTLNINMARLVELGWIKRETRYTFHMQEEFNNA